MDSKPAPKSAGDNFVKGLRKISLRSKERILEKLGKSEQTQDELFDEYVNNITKQQNNALRLQKEVKNYVACVKAMAVASKSLHDVIGELYESEWAGQGQIKAEEERLQTLRADRTKNIGEDILNDMQHYLNQFPEAKAKVAKRNRKLVDFDGARYSLSAVVNAPKKNEFKIAKAKDELHTMQKLYEDLNDELHRELPALYDSRLGFYGHTLKAIWQAETNYHADAALCFKDLSDIADKLSEEGKGSYKHIHVPSASSASAVGGGTGKRPVISGPIRQDSTNSPAVDNKDVDFRRSGNGPDLDVHFRAKTASPTPLPNQNGDSNIASGSTSEKGSSLETGHSDSPAPAAVERTASSRMYPVLPVVDPNAAEVRVVKKHNRLASLPSSDDDDAFVDVPEATSPDLKLAAAGALGDSAKSAAHSSETHVRDLPGGHAINVKVERKVKATNPYMAEDADELSFDKGEIILVVPYENPDEQVRNH
ncbi:putative Amphiphysin [Hypsibius exemplaris]|uniref:Amphiphysin n=1 Tax=Hypsibius exemplaris TaxID=2072580 RepID=A0A1W0XEB5_HYPEX|nr:putative Amphiphysin [Hypsibius exemplaris]